MSALVDRARELPRPLLVALDVDGTLAPIVDDPTAARVPSATVATLLALDARPDVVVALITGRDAVGLAAVAPGSAALWRAVEHGRVLVRPGVVGLPPDLDATQRTRLAAFAAEARGSWVPEGARLERKSGSWAVHVRELPADASEAILDAAAARATAIGLHPRRGRAVLEAEAKPGDKGEALERLMEVTGAASCVFAGDDLTDAPAITFAAERGLGLFVRSSERTQLAGANGLLEDPEDVARFLDGLRAAL